MRKLMLTIAGLLFVSVMAVNAQVAQDTTSTSGSASGSSTMGTDQSSNYTKDMEVIQSSDIPSSLRSTLQGSEYSGWEEGKVYRNTSTNEYLIVIGDDNAKVYRFDANGSRIQDLNSDSNSSGSSSGTPSGSSSGTTGSGSTGSSSSSDGSTGSSSSGSTSGTTGTTGSGSSSGTTGTTGSGSSSGSTSGSTPTH